jgi:4-aminobutyrate aminotransferase-like enzyme
VSTIPILNPKPSTQAFLDCVNNPAGVGHCHPLVVRAAADQFSTLNTNTRYVFPELNEYAERLCATLPSSLSVCYFVNSGSEANDLALRLARWHTQQQDVVCVQGGYHGHTDAVIDVSPYKFDKAVNRPVPPTTHKVPAPDAYRDPRSGAAMAESVKEAVDGIKKEGRKPALFICEGALSCAGYIPIPDGYLKAAYAHVRAHGGLCLSDEVQSGFGRPGCGMMWAFQRAGVVPDIVTMGKPMGNGFPLAAVITTREVAESFASCGMEYFNTFGGGPVAMRVGSAVLDAMEKDNLLVHVEDVGSYLQGRLGELRSRFSVIGDVRGHGLFLGVELVKDRDSKEPAPLHAEWLCEALRCRGVLMNTDGIHGNVFKMKPPLCISRAHVDLLVQTLEEVLSLMPQDDAALLLPQEEVPAALARVNRVVEEWVSFPPPPKP